MGHVDAERRRFRCRLARWSPAGAASSALGCAGRCSSEATGWSASTDPSPRRGSRASACWGSRTRWNASTLDLLDGGDLSRALTEQEVGSVFHLAAQTLVGAAAASPWPRSRRTFGQPGCCSRPAAAGRGTGGGRLLGQGVRPPRELPYREDFALQPRSPYEASKAAADLIARSYWHSLGLPVAVTRFANVYGGADTNFSRLVPEAVSAALDGRPPVLRSDGSPERDFLLCRRRHGRLSGDSRRTRSRRGARRGLQRRRRAPVSRCARWST